MINTINVMVPSDFPVVNTTQGGYVVNSKRPTAGDVARLAGVSQSTVSMILNSKPGASFSTHTINKVVDAARELNYDVKKSRRFVVDREDPFIAVVSPTLANPYYSALVQSFENEASARGYGTLVCNTYRDPNIENRYIDLFSKSALHGIVFTFMPYHWAKVKALSLSMPTVIVSDKNQSMDIDTVELNSTEAGELIARHLLELGHRKMAFLTTPLGENNLPRARRLQGLRNEIQAAGGELIVAESTTGMMLQKYSLDLEYDVGHELAQAYVNDPSVTALIGINDMVAFGILDALEERGISVPGERSVCGFDNIFPSKFRRVALTTIDSFLTAKGRDAFELLYRKMPHEEPQPQTGIFRIEYKPELVVRGSTGPCPAPCGKHHTAPASQL